MKKMFKGLGYLVLVLILSLTLGIGMVACSNPKPITLTAEASTLEVGEEISIVATGEEIESLVWTSSNSSVASVDENGKVKALAVGETTIKAYRSTEKVDSEDAGTCLITVVNTGVAPTISVTNDNWTMLSGQELSIGAKVHYGSDLLNVAVAYESDNESVAIIDNTGKITAVSEGFATITISSEYRGRTATQTYDLTVFDCIINIEKTSVTLYTDSNNDAATYPMTHTVEAELILAQGEVDATITCELVNQADSAILSVDGATISVVGGIAEDSKNISIKVICTYEGEEYSKNINVSVKKAEIACDNVVFETSKDAYAIELDKAVDIEDLTVLFGLYRYELTVSAVEDNTIVLADITAALEQANVAMGEKADLVVVTPFAKYMMTAVVYDYYIDSSEDFQAFVDMGKASENADAYFALGANIDAKDELIDNLFEASAFAGVLDGNGYTIKNISTKKGFFNDLTATAIVKDLGMEIKVVGALASTAFAPHKVASGFCANNSGTIKDCYINIEFTSGVLTDGGTLIGGFGSFRDKDNYNTIGSFAGNVIIVNFDAAVLSAISNSGALVACAPMSGEYAWIGQFVNNNYVVSNSGQYVRAADGYPALANTSIDALVQAQDGVYPLLTGAYWTVVEKVPQMKKLTEAFVEYAPPAAPEYDLLIDSVEDLETFISWGTDVDLQTQYSSAKIVLGANIDANGLLINQLFKDTGFAGTFDGKGYTISNVTTKGGIFYNLTATGIVENVGFANLNVVGYVTSANAYSHTIASGLLTISSGVVKNCYFDIIMTAETASCAIRGGIISGRGDDDGSHIGTISNNYIKVTFEGGSQAGNAGVILGCEGIDSYWTASQLGTNYLVSNHEYPVREAYWSAGYGKAYANNDALKTATSGVYENLTGSYWSVVDGLPVLASK